MSVGGIHACVCESMGQDDSLALIFTAGSFMFDICLIIYVIVLSVRHEALSWSFLVSYVLRTWVGRSSPG